jgi:hypothetical protein
MVEVSISGGGSICLTIIPPPVFRKFEHKLQYGGGSGDSGGYFYTKRGELNQS